jgi:hypothetical protein
MVLTQVSIIGGFFVLEQTLMLFVEAKTTIITGDKSMDVHITTAWVWIILSLLVWEMAWKGLALWRAGRNNQPGWFIALLVINSAGLLPMVYLWLSGRQNSSSR